MCEGTRAGSSSWQLLAVWLAVAAMIAGAVIGADVALASEVEKADGAVKSVGLPKADREALARELAPLAKRWDAARGELGIPGLAVAVVDARGVVSLETFGLRDVDRELPVTPDTMFYIASITKTYVATALAKLAEQGEVDLNRPVQEILPRFRLPDAEAASRITVEDLLCHRPGIGSGPIVFLDAYTGEITEDRYWYWMERAEVEGVVSYSNVHITLAGRVVEAVSGSSWRDHLKEALFDPLALGRTTGYADTMYADEDVAYPYVRSDGELVLSPRKTDRTMHAAGGLGTSITDAGRWISAQLGDGSLDGVRVLASETLRDIHRERSRPPRPTGDILVREGFGLGWMTGRYRGRRCLEHGGGYVGASAHVSFLPEAGVGVAVLMNGDRGAPALGEMIRVDVYDRVLGLEPEDLLPLVLARYGTEAEAERSAFSRSRRDGARRGPDPLEMFDWEGTFANEHWGTVRATKDASGLRVAIGDAVTRFRGERRGRFSLVRSSGEFARGRVADTTAREDGPDRVDAISLELRGRQVRFERVTRR